MTPAARCEAALAGLALGNALALPLTGLKEGHIRQLFGPVATWIDPCAAFPDRPGKWRLGGLYAASAQQALAAAEVLAVYADADADALAGLFLRLLAEGPSDTPCGAHRSPGSAFRKALLALQAGAPALDAGQPAADAAPAARCIPAGLYYPDDPPALFHAVVRFTLVTHNDPRAISAALAAAAAVAGLLALPGPAAAGDLLALAEDLPPRLRRWEEQIADEYGDHLDPASGRDRLYAFSGALKALAPLVRENNEALAAATLLREANACGPANPVAQVQDAFAPACVLAALYRAFAARSFPDGLLTVLNAGGQASEAAAVAGALLGARFGMDQIPDEWLDGLLNAPQIRIRARALAERAVDWSAWDDYVETEIALSLRERDFVAGRMAQDRARLQKAKQRQEERKAGPAKTPPPSTGFAPPPPAWLHAPNPRALPAWEALPDPEQARRDKALRGRRRIDWKETRREARKNADAPEPPEAPEPDDGE